MLKSGTADIQIQLSDETTLELLNDSSGYEPWGFSPNQVTLVSTAGGDVFPT